MTQQVSPSQVGPGAEEALRWGRPLDWAISPPMTVRMAGRPHGLGRRTKVRPNMEGAPGTATRGLAVKADRDLPDRHRIRCAAQYPGHVDPGSAPAPWLHSGARADPPRRRSLRGRRDLCPAAHGPGGVRSG